MNARLLLAAAALALLGMARPPATDAAPPPPSAAATPPPPAVLAIPPDSRPFVDDPQALGITVEGGENTDDEFQNVIRVDSEFTIQFPNAMVAPDRIDAEDAQSPLHVWPELEATWVWRTQSMGVWRVRGPLIPGQTYRLRLRDGLANLDGQPLPVDKWGYEVKTVPLTVSSETWERESLGAQPQIPLEFNYPVRLADAAAGCWFQNRLTRERFPAEILLNRAASEVTGDVLDVQAGADQPAPREFRVRPRAPLPVGQFYDLVVESVGDAYAGRTLPYPRVFALGRTRFYEVDYVVARNWPQDRPHLEVKFRGHLADAPLPSDVLTIEPAVPHLRLRREGEFLRADGDFDVAQRYRVTISAAITGDRGFPLARAETWGATFRPKQATLTFPEGLIRQRAALGLRFALLQANTGPITWRLAPVALDRLAAAQAAVRANAANVIDALALRPVATGEIPAATDDQEIVRPIEWKPAADTPLSGPYVLSASARDSAGATVTNNALVFFGDMVFTPKTTPAGTVLRLADMADARPRAGVTVRVVTAALNEIARGVTDDAGVVAFPAAALAGSAFFLAETPGALSVEVTTPGAAFAGTGSSYSVPAPPYRGRIITDRPLYRPGEEIAFKGFLRRNDAGELVAPAGAKLAWRVESEDRGDRVAEGTTTVNAFGGWDATWTPPLQGRLGGFRITARIGETDAGDSTSFRVEEFRNPPFSVLAEVVPSPRAAESTVQVASAYFHGAPNVGSRVKWTATWTSDFDGEYYFNEDADGFKQVDLYSEQRRTPAFDGEVSGEATLDANGRATLTAPAPFRDPGLRAHADVSWRVDVTGPDGQTITGGASDKVVMNDVTLGVRAVPDRRPPEIAFDLRAIPRDQQTKAPAEVTARLFLVRTKSVKERLAPFVYRYRNTDEYVPIEERTVPANGPLAFTPKTPGRYVLVVTPTAGQPGITVSDEVILPGEGEAELPVENDQTLVLRAVDPAHPAPVGSLAAFDLLAPSPGIAWITVETDAILDTFTVPVPGNATRIEIPVKPGYAPNVHVSAYLLRPGRTDALPGEMYGSADLAVVQPDATIELTVSSDRPEYQPRQAGRVTVRATAAGRPVPDAEITLYAVDDAILELGGWTLPELLSTFLPDQPFSVVTRLALTGYVDQFREKSLTQKGVVVGEGGKDEFGNSRFVRQNFRPRILWLPSLETNADGVATAPFETPDNLTRFRLVALAQTRTNQFGSGDATFTVSKPLLVEPALPRFLRAGDEIELRAVARQKAMDSANLTIRCEPGAGLTLLGPAEVTRTAARNDPAVATFRARVAGNVDAASVRFSVEAPGDLADATEVKLPVAPRTITVRESVAGGWKGGSFAPAKVAPAAWATSAGTVDVTLSTSPDLARLLGLPALLDYPYGCFEQKSSRLLADTTLARLLAFLPQPADRREHYGQVIAATLAEFERSLLPDDQLPYWPFGLEGNAFVTIQAAWAAAQAGSAGYDVPENLAVALPRALRQIALRQTRLEVEPTLRAFALFVLAQLGEEPDDELVAAARELFLTRERLTDEGRAFLAMALHSADLEPSQQQELLRAIPETTDARAFNPATFSSTTRAEAIILRARLLIAPDTVSPAQRARLEARLAESTSLSTQENLWLLIAFDALLTEKPPARLARDIAPSPDVRSANGASASWLARDLPRLAKLAIRGAGRGGAYVLAARRELSPAEQVASGRGLRLDRIVKNLTDPARTGAPEAPFKLGDQILVSFRFHGDQPQSYVALEDPLPAGLEILNPNLEMIGKFYRIPDEPGVPTAWLSFSEMRDRQTNLFFDSLAAGTHSYAILARATAAGTFAWPSAQMSPMYDARFHARSAPSTCVVTE